MICRALNISRSTINREATYTKSQTRRTEIISEMRKIYEESNKVYGAPKNHSELTSLGYRISIRTVSKYMQITNIKSIRQNKFKV